MPHLTQTAIEPEAARARLVPPGSLAALAQAARCEDMGEPPTDPTSELLVDAEARIEAMFTARAPGRLCGGALMQEVAAVFDRSIEVQPHLPDGSVLQAGTAIATIRGPGRSVLAAERTCLNLVTHLSGIATATSRYVAAAAAAPGSRAAIYDTRKTLPGYRGLAKYAVICGGGQNHRQGLFDAVLIKDNHLAGLDEPSLRARLERVIPAARERETVSFIEVEVDTLEQLRIVLELPGHAMPDIVLLDNMTPQTLAEAVAMRNRLAPQQVELEASGGVNLDTVTAIAAAGVDRIAVGAITHSAVALDIGLDAVSPPAGT